jgi:hypothetical protein
MGTYVSKYTGSEIDENIGKIKTFAETDPTVPEEVKAITATDINNWNNKPEKSDIPKLVTLTQAEYDALVSANTVDENTYYFIKEE